MNPWMTVQVRSSVEVAVADKPATAGEEGFNFGAYMKERAVLVNEALDRSVPLQYPDVIHESMRCGGGVTAPASCMLLCEAP